MFLVNSRLGQITAASSSSESKSHHSTEASLLPKLRDHFAEFLNEGSLDHLGILYLPTCVGLRYGLRKLKLRDFSWKRDIGDLILMDSSLTSMLHPRICLRAPPQSSHRDNQRPACLTFSVPPSHSREVQEY